ncbi:MAG: hypothetical protein HYY31_03215, partial [Chloroflexi bacterium]|nr:hypothetical protein [Chloroflexota bacterium]
CGNIKLAWNRYTPTEVEERICRASGRVSGKLNIPIALHCIYRGAPPDVNPGVHMIDILTSEGTKPSKIKIDHHMSTGGNLVPLLEVLRRGAYLGFETLSTSEEAVTRLTTTIGGLIAAGYVSQLLLCPQTIAPGWINVQPPWNVKNWNQDHSYLHREILPRMRKGGVTEKDIEQLLVVNPKNFLCF